MVGTRPSPGFATCFHAGAKERIALQTHLPLPHDFGNRVVLQFLPEGYSGQAPVGDGELNLCLVSVPRKMPALRNWAEARFGISPRTLVAHDHSADARTHRRCPSYPFSWWVMRRGWWSRLRAKEFITRLLRANSPRTRSFLNTTDGMKPKLRPPTPPRMPNFIADGSGSIGSREPRYYLRGSPRHFLEVARFQPALLRFLTAKIVR